jgi:dienelactone hydrolase
VVFAGGAFHSVDENVVLWEYLASHGYVVAGFPSVGIGSANLLANAPGLETTARDVEAVIAYLHRVPFADRTRLGAVGFSIGGAAALVVAARSAWIDAVAGLDPSFIAARHLCRIMRSSAMLLRGALRWMVTSALR